MQPSTMERRMRYVETVVDLVGDTPLVRWGRVTHVVGGDRHGGTITGRYLKEVSTGCAGDGRPVGVLPRHDQFGFAVG